MLSGIKKGRAKKKSTQKDAATAKSLPSNSTLTSASSSFGSNLSVAEQLRRSFASGGTAGDISNDVNNPKSTSGDLAHRALERTGRIQGAPTSSSAAAAAAATTTNSVVVGMTNTSSKAERMITGESGPSRATAGMSVDEEMARNVMRLGKKRKQKAKSGADSDEEEIRMHSMMMPSESKKVKSAKKQEEADEKEQRRAISRDISLHDKQDRITSRCWWWLESSQFAKHRLISLGNYVSLVMAPLNLSLTAGRHLYIVPIKHSESLVACEDEVWDEITRFETSLRNLFEKEYNQGVLFSETVLPTNTFWQSKMEVIPIKRKLWRDSELYFKSTLTEQADEFGTHNKLLSTKEKGIRRTVPKGFPYFYIEWDAPNQGYAQIIESSSFPQDFAADTIAGMAGLDPLRFKKKQKFTPEQERQYILEFLEKWKKYDWTEKLDS